MKKANIDQTRCVACGECAWQCPRKSISIKNGLYAAVDQSLCVGCGLCVKHCPAGCISLTEVSA